MSRKHFSDFKTMRSDAAGNAFLKRELNKAMGKVYEEVYPDLEARSFLPVSNEVNWGAETFTTAIMQSVGQAKIGGKLGDDTPRVDVSIGEKIHRTIPLSVAYGWNIQEAASAQFAGRPLSALKGKTARAVIEQGLDELMLIGSSKDNLEGFFGLSNTCTNTIINDGSGSGADKLLWANKTNLQILRDLNAIVRQIRSDTRKKESPDTLIVADTAFNFLNDTPMSVDNGMSLLEMFIRNSKFIKRIEGSQYLEADAGHGGASGLRRMVAYKKSSDKVEAQVPLEFTQLAPEVQNFEVIVNCHAKYGEIKNPFPKSICYADGY